MIKPEDDYFHQRSDDPYWNESAWFPLMVPERDLSGWVYFYHRPNMNFSVGGIALWDPSGDQHYNCRYYDWGDIWPLPAGAEMFDFELGSGLRSRCVSPLKQFEFGYHRNGVAAELEWTASAEPYDAAWGHNKDSKDWGKGHYEQSGTMSGAITLPGGDRLEIDCLSNRDHSWGPRHFIAAQGGDFPWALTPDGDGFHVLVNHPADAEHTRTEEVTANLTIGWYRKDHTTAALTSAQRRTVERGADGRPLRVELEGVDELGRTLSAQGECRNWLKWTGYPTSFQWWSLTRWSFDGRQAYGEVQEYYPCEIGRALHRSAPVDT